MSLKNRFFKNNGTPHIHMMDFTIIQKNSIKKSFEKIIKKNLTENINIDYASEYMLDQFIEKAK